MLALNLLVGELLVPYGHNQVAVFQDKVVGRVCGGLHEGGHAQECQPQLAAAYPLDDGFSMLVCVLVCVIVLNV